MQSLKQLKQYFFRNKTKMHHLKDSDSLNFESSRRATFGPNCSETDKTLALCGFYLVDIDKVKCRFCYLRGSIQMFSKEPVKEHLKQSQNCPLLIGRETDNSPICLKALKKTLPPPQAFDELDMAAIEHDVIVTILPFPQYATLTERLNSFTKSSTNKWAVDIKDLAECGFFYTGVSDRVACFTCELVLQDFEPSDNVWKEHRKHSPYCSPRLDQ